MKKLLMVLLCMALLFSGACAGAETVKLGENASSFDIQVVLPEGASLTYNEFENDYTNIGVIKDGVKEVIVTIAPSEEYAGLSMNDLSDDEISLLAEQTASDFSQYTVKIDATPSGNQYVLITAGEENNFATLFTVYRGYFVQLAQFDTDFSALSEADTAFMLEVLYGIEFVDVAP
ncbi:MAG: hypothetical protein PHI98_12015 [Eubacteriales bacterium]|nr:hypothetical protein [Eubacteriales bacterium]